MGARDGESTAQRRARLIEEQQQRFEASGKTAAAFCEEEGVVLSTFYQRRARWQKRQDVQGAAFDRRRPAFIDAGSVKVDTLTRAQPSAQAAGERERLEVRIDLGGGVVLHVSRI